MLLSCSEMRTLEERAFADGCTAAELMEEAGEKIAEAVREFFPFPGRCLVFFGRGHNGGDALVAARHLQRYGWSIELRAIFPPESWSELTAIHHQDFKESQRITRREVDPFELSTRSQLVVLDGLLGIGARGALREPIRAGCAEINRLRREENAHVFALDLPSGLDGDSGAADPNAVIADCTLTIGFPKHGLVADEAINHVGRIAVLPLKELTKRGESGESAQVATAAELAQLLPPRNFDTHKGSCGRIGILAGSAGLTGAAVMCAEGAVRGGAGLVTLYVPPAIESSVAARTTPEVMVQPIGSPLELLEKAHDVLAIGPGLGREHAEAVLQLVARTEQPIVLDADALNILSSRIEALSECAGLRLLTPHPGEMARLDPDSAGRSRRTTVEEFTRRFPHVLLLKGARSLIGQRGQPLSYNSTGHPGLASGGVGDVLTGLLAALTGQGLSLYNAARIGAWIIGRAAERAVFFGGESAESLRATAVLAGFGGAFRDLRARCW